MQEFLFVPTILFLVIVAPIWLVLHYRYKSKMARGLNVDDHSNFDEMLETLDKLADRISALEEILDTEHSSWHEQDKKGGRHG